MKHNFKRFLSLLLALVMVLGMFPMGHAHAEETVNVLSKPVTEVQADVEYEIFFGGRTVHASIKQRRNFTALDSGEPGATAIASDAKYIWTLKAAEDGYKIYSAAADKYVKMIKNTAALVDEAEAQIFDFTYHADGGNFDIKARGEQFGYFNNLGDENVIGGWETNGTKFVLRQVLRDHTHNPVDVPAVEATLNSTGLAAGVECADCGAVISGRESIPVVDYNDGIVPVDKITPTAGSYNTPTHSNDGGPAYALDSNLETRWHTNYSGNSAYGANDPENRWIDFAINGAYDVTALRYKGRAGNGNITKYTIQVSYDGVVYENLITEGIWANNADWKEVVFETPLELVKNVRLLAVESAAGHAVATEMRLVGTKHEFAQHTHTQVEIPAVEATWDGPGKTAGYKCSECGEILTEQKIVPALYNQGIVPLDKLNVTAGDWETSGGDSEGPAYLVIDDNINTLWHTEWHPGGNDNRSNFWIDFALDGNYQVTGLYYKPRKDAINGTITEYKIMVSYDNGLSYVEHKTGEWNRTDSWKIVIFDKVYPTNVKLVATKTYSDQEDNGNYFASAAEMRLVGTTTDHKHDFVAGTSVDPTCTEAGYTTYTCSVEDCGATYNVAGEAATGHTPAEATRENEKAATCTEAGSYDEVVYCSVCKTHEISREPKTIDPLNHLDENKDNICDREGCGATICAHTNTEKIPGKNATCTETGLTEGLKCNDCGTVLTEQTEIPVIPHDWVDATCDEAKHCSACPAIEGTALGHTAADDDGDCTTAVYCVRNCGTIVIPAAEKHTYTNDYDSTCNIEGCTATRQVKQFNSEQLTGLTGEASSNDAGDGSSIGEAFDGFTGTTGNYWASVKNDNGIDGNEWLIANLNGEYLLNKVEYSKRYHEGQPNDGYDCTGNLLDYIIEVRVGEGEWQRVAAGATESQGTTVITFAPIHATQVRLTATQSYHWQDGTNNQPDNRNKVMAVAEFAVYKAVCLDGQHTEGEAVTEGNETVVYCTVCGTVLSRTTIACEHEYEYECSTNCKKCGEKTRREATHASDAKYPCVAGKCLYCGEDVFASTMHDYDDGREFAPTCGTDGYTLYTCRTCGGTKTEAGAPATGDHNWGEGVVTTPATCTKDGEKTSTCSGCGATSTEIIPATGHVNTSLIGAKEATCGAEGYTGDLVCDKCGVTVTPGTAIPATDKHTYEESDRVEPTYTTEGSVTYKCSGCDAEYTDTLPVKAKLKIVGATMTLGNSLDMNFLVNEADLIEGAYAVITKTFADGREDVVVKTAEWTDYAYNESLRYVKLSDLSAKEMTDTITVVVYDAKGNAISEVWTDSMKDYAMRLIEQQEAAKTSNMEYLTFAVDMLNYGAAAQQIFNYNTDNLANADLTDAQKAYATADITIENKQVKDDKIVGATLLLQNSIQLNFIYKTSDIAEGMYAVATYTNHRGDEKTVEIPYDQFGKLDKAGVYTYIPVADSAMADCRQMITLTVYKADGSVFSTATDSVESYCARINSNDALYTEIMKLADSAYALFH